MKKLILLFPPHIEGVFIYKNLFIKKRGPKMQKLFENWRKFVNEAKQETIPREIFLAKSSRVYQTTRNGC